VTANAVARIDNLDFLADVIPRTTTYKQFKEKKARDDASAAAAAPVAPGQTTLSNGFGGPVRGGHLEPEPEELSGEDVNGVSSNGNRKQPLRVNGSPMADRTIRSSAHGHPPHQMRSDVDMED
jgi:hypothetical protein